ncbi:MAG TPA: hypothetical protein EYH41_06670 [Novosphingobium capsulatum]|nr:hypothetical protein [Novosphingobium capsulatum]
MAPQVKPTGLVDVQAGHKPTLSRRCQPDIIRFDEGATSNINETIAENILLQQQLAIATLEGPQIHSCGTKTDRLGVDAAHIAYRHEVSGIADADHESRQKRVIIVAKPRDHIRELA